ncbi:hypothetical protein DYB26_009004 [Aphanomyces astaci]|uniref:Uncharacterized protein n=1 Tax=Aphanomyces astaci TaxID=112090 RepID=A0A418CPV1_APHAT|nr:hypothetical protein DYB26_009004 [Aphanomyces astaci]
MCLCQSNVVQGSRLLETCEPLIASTPSYFYFVIVFLRKSLVSPSPDLAITHLCHLLKSPATSAVQREDLASCLNDALYLSACRHLALCHVQLVPDVTPFDRGVRHCLSTLMELDSSSLLLHMDQHSGGVLRHCLALLPRLSSATQEFGRTLTTHLKSVVSRSHCRAFLDAAPDRAVAAAYYASLAGIAGMQPLRCRLLTSLPLSPPTSSIPTACNLLHDLPTADLLDGLQPDTCCVHWSMYCVHHLHLRLATLSPADKSTLARHSVALYVTWHHTSTDVIVDPHPMPDLKLLQTRKSVKPHDVLTCILKLWPSLGPAAMGPHLWGVTTWKPVSHALLAQLDPFLDTQRHIGLSVAIAEYLLVLWTRFDPLLFGRVAFSGPRRVYRLVCQHVVSSPKLLASLLQLVWVDPTLLVARVGAVLQEAQSLSTLESPFHDVAAPTLTTDATRKVAYADALKQFEQRCCVANPPAAAAASIHDLVRLAKVAWHRPSVSYVHATRAMDAWLRVGKASLVQLMAPTDEDFVSQWSVVSAVVQTCVDVGVGWKQDPQRIWRGNDAAAVKRVIRTITTHVMEVADRPKRTKWTVHHPLPHTKRKRNTATPVRSRHPYIDDCLQEEESGDDAYADLEDFIVD